MRNRLGTVDEYERIGCARLGRHFLDRVDRAERIGDMRNSDYLGSMVDQTGEFVRVDLAATGNGCGYELGAGLRTDELPRHDIRVVLHMRDEHFVAGLEFSPAKRRGHEIDGLRGTARKDDLAARARVDESAYSLSRCLVSVGRALAQLVHATVNVRVIVLLVFDHRIDDALRPLR